jgi:hypothetical protein
MAREKLNVMTMIRQSQLCHSESRDGQCRRRQAGKALDMLDVGHPDIDWCRLAAGMGVSASGIRTLEEFADQLVAALKAAGPPDGGCAENAQSFVAGGGGSESSSRILRARATSARADFSRPSMRGT